MLINISKFLFITFLFYIEWFQVVFIQIPNMLFLLGSGMFIFIILHAFQTKLDMVKVLTMEFYLWGFFALSSLFLGMLVAVNYGFLISAISSFVQYLILMYCIVYISIQDDNIDFFINVYILLAIVCAITAVFWGIDYEDGRISMGFRNNPNSLGEMMVIGISFILYKLNIKKMIVLALSFSVIFLLIYVAILTGSRKALLSLLLVNAYWFMFVIFDEIKKLTISEKLKGLFIIIFALLLGCYIFNPLLKDSVAMERISTLLEEGAGAREEMYRVAMELFKKNPLIGIGFNNYRAVTIFATYSHSTYAEALACTGIIGSFFYFSVYILIFFKYTRLITYLKDDIILLKQAKVMLGLFVILLFLGTGVIHFYETSSSIVFGMILAFYKVNSNSSNKLKVGVYR